MRVVRSVALAGLLMTCALSAQDRPVQTPPPVTFRLVTDVDAVTPGATVTVGLFLKHEKGWHTYWKNPGTVGMATRVKWTLPKGWTAGPLLWQRPQLTKMGVYTVWGYEGEALLLTDIQVPRKLGAKASVKLRAAVSYMVCSKTCRPGNADVELVLPQRAKAKPRASWRTRFDDVRRQQPRKLGDRWTVSAKRVDAGYELTLMPKPRPKQSKNGAKPGSMATPKLTKLYFFSEAKPRLVSSDLPQTFRRDGARLVLRVGREKFSPEKGTRLRGVLVSDGLGRDTSMASFAIDVVIGDR